MSATAVQDPSRHDALFGEILERDPCAEIVMLESRRVWAEQMKQRFARTLRGNARRVRFLPAMPHPRLMATLAAADVAIDPLYFEGCNSSVEALSLGVPVVTLPGTHLHGRFTLGLYSEIGLHDCVVTSPGEYVETSLRLATEPDYRENVSTRLLERAPLLFERKDATHAFADCITKELDELR